MTAKVVLSYCVRKSDQLKPRKSSEMVGGRARVAAERRMARPLAEDQTLGRRWKPGKKKAAPPDDAPSPPPRRPGIPAISIGRRPGEPSSPPPRTPPEDRAPQDRPPPRPMRHTAHEQAGKQKRMKLIKSSSGRERWKGLWSRGLRYLEYRGDVREKSKGRQHPSTAQG